MQALIHEWDCGFGEKSARIAVSPSVEETPKGLRKIRVGCLCRVNGFTVMNYWNDYGDWPLGKEPACILAEHLAAESLASLEFAMKSALEDLRKLMDSVEPATAQFFFLMPGTGLDKDSQ